MNQQEYIEKMVIPEKTPFKGERDLTEKEMTLYRSEVGKLNWLSQQTRPNLASDMYLDHAQTCT